MKNKTLFFMLIFSLFINCQVISQEKMETDNMNSWNKSVAKINNNGKEIYGISYVPNIDKKYPVVIFSHGFNGTSKDFSMYSQYLAERGIGSYSFDFCGGSINSKSSLKTTEMTIFTEKEDLAKVIEEVKTWENVDKENIFLFGGSQGGLVTALVAEEYEKEIKGMLLLFPAFCIAEDWTKKFPRFESIPEEVNLWGVNLGKEFFQTIYKYDVYKNIGKFEKSVLIFHGDKDNVVHLKYSEKAIKSYKNAKLEVFANEGHGFKSEANKKVAKMIKEFVESKL